MENNIKLKLIVKKMGHAHNIQYTWTAKIH